MISDCMRPALAPLAGCPAELWKITGFMDQLQHMRWNAQMAITTQQLLFHHHHCAEGKIISLFFLEEMRRLRKSAASNAVHLKHNIERSNYTELQHHNFLDVEYPKLDGWFWYRAWHSSLPPMDASSVTRPGSSKSAAEGPKYPGHSAPSDFLLTAAIQSTTLSIPALKSDCDYLWLQVHELVGKPKAT